MSKLLSQVKTLSKKYLPLMVQTRRTIHQNPELGWEEVATSKLIQKELTKAKIPFILINKIGILATVKGSLPGKVVLLRADMDALPLTELVNVPYKSKVPGKMHACGHDCHTANLLGAALVLNELKNKINGTIKFMFQPSEETGIGGALPMIEAGILTNPKVDAAFGLHTGQDALGTVTFQYGSASGCPDDFKIELIGSGGHGAAPDKTTDLISVAAQFIVGCQTIISRRLDPTLPSLITFGEFKCGNTHNVIASSCLLTGTCRSNNENIRKKLYQMFENLLKTTCATNGCTYKFDYLWSYPPVINNTTTTTLVKNTLVNLMGAKNVIEITAPSLGGEDFAYIAKEVPATFYYVGIAEKNKPFYCCQAHNPNFSVNDEKWFPIANLTLVEIALNFLEKNK